MEKTFRIGSYRKDRKLLVISTVGDRKDLLNTVCCNCETGYVRETGMGSVLIPIYAKVGIVAHLEKMGWRMEK